MDRKGVIGVAVCIGLYLFFSLYFAHLYPPAHAPAVTAGASPASTNADVPAPPPAAAISESNAASPTPTPATPSVAVSPAAPTLPEKLNFLENNNIRITFTTRGAAIKTIDLKNHREGDGDVILNAGSRSNVMALTGWPGADETAFAVQSAPAALTYTASAARPRDVDPQLQARQGVHRHRAGHRGQQRHDRGGHARLLHQRGQGQAAAGAWPLPADFQPVHRRRLVHHGPPSFTSQPWAISTPAAGSLHDLPATCSPPRRRTAKPTSSTSRISTRSNGWRWKTSSSPCC